MSKGLLGINADVVVITATALETRRRKWLLDLHASLKTNECNYVHAVVLDGALEADVPGELRECPNTVILGSQETDSRDVGGLRNEALMRCASTWVTGVDDDDVLTERSLDTRLAAASDGHHWVGGHVADLIAGAISPRWVQPAVAGDYRPGRVLELWDSPEAVLPYFSGSLLLRTSTAIALGGWGTGWTDEDVFLNIALTNVTSGRVIDDVVVLYRKHDGQRTASTDYQNRVAGRRKAIRQRARFVEELILGPATTTNNTPSPS